MLESDWAKGVDKVSAARLHIIVSKETDEVEVEKRTFLC